jgi:uncharacterized membrane protein YdbT with pleckstrin-like domain
MVTGPRYARLRTAAYACRVTINLHAGETVIFEGHPSWRSILGFYLKGIAIAAVAGAVTALGTNLFGDETDNGLVFLVVLAIIAVAVLIGFIKRVATTYTITNRRLHIKRGIVSREIQETRLERVQNVNFRQTIFQRAMQIGDVDFDTAASDDYNFVFAGVGNPADVVHSVDSATGLDAAGAQGLGEAQPAARQDEPPGAPPPQA